jgi:hypothetical protein
LSNVKLFLSNAFSPLTYIFTTLGKKKTAKRKRKNKPRRIISSSSYQSLIRSKS